MAIKVWDYLDEFEQERAEVYEAIEKVLTSGWLILGENVREFEESFASYCGRRFGVGVNSGTDAIFLGLKALGVGPGDEVITVSNTAVPTVSAIVSTGATPVFVDIDPVSYLMDTSQLAEVVSANSKCILPVHLYGQCVNMDQVNELATKHGLGVLEDCAQATGAECGGRKAGAMSDMAAFSFYPTKVLGGYGDGGMVITSSEQFSAKLKSLRFYGMDGSYYSKEHGYNSRLDELHAAILLKKLVHLEDYIAKRMEIAEIYSQNLKDRELILPEVSEGNRHVFYVYVCRHPDRDRLIGELKKKDIFLNISYPWPIHTMEAYQYLGYREGDLPHTEVASREIFSLPIYPSLSRDKVEQVCLAIKEII